MVGSLSSYFARSKGQRHVVRGVQDDRAHGTVTPPSGSAGPIGTGAHGRVPGRQQSYTSEAVGRPTAGVANANAAFFRSGVRPFLATIMQAVTCSKRAAKGFPASDPATTHPLSETDRLASIIPIRAFNYYR